MADAFMLLVNAFMLFVLVAYLAAGFLTTRRDSHHWERRGHDGKPYEMSDKLWRQTWKSLDKETRKQLNRAIRRGRAAPGGWLREVGAEAARRSVRDRYRLILIAILCFWLELHPMGTSSRAQQVLHVGFLVLWGVVLLAGPPMLLLARRAERESAEAWIRQHEPQAF